MWHMGDGWGWWMGFGSIWMVGFWAVIIWAVFTMGIGQASPRALN